MKLPDYERVIYQRNPLIEVVCLLRFPTILKISNQEPAEFQDVIRFDYPIYEVQKTVNIPGLPTEVLKMSQQLGISLNTQNTIYHFKSENLRWQLSLNQEFISLSTTEYERYEDFKLKFQKVLQIFENIYQPSFYTRVNLKYQDLIVRSNLDIKDKNWSELIPAHIASELHSPEIAASLKASIKNIEIRIEDVENGQLKFNHGLVIAQDEEKKNQEAAYLLESDFFTIGRLDKKDVWTIVDKFKHSAGKLFRWSITEELHDAMEPKSISTND